MHKQTTYVLLDTNKHGHTNTHIPTITRGDTIKSIKDAEKGPHIP